MRAHGFGLQQHLHPGPPGYESIPTSSAHRQAGDRQCAGYVPKVGAERFDFLSRRWRGRANPIEILEPEHQQPRLLLRGGAAQCEFVSPWTEPSRPRICEGISRDNTHLAGLACSGHPNRTPDSLQLRIHTQCLGVGHERFQIEVSYLPAH